MKTKYLVYFIVLGVLVFGTMSCQPDTQKQNNTHSKIFIVTTTGMIADIVKNIVKERAEVQAIMKAGTDPHLYKATRQDLDLLRKADIVFYNGLHLEGKMSEVLEKLAVQKAVWAVSDAINSKDLRKIDEHAPDPHLWFDVSLWQKVARHVGEKIAEKDNANAEYYLKNMLSYNDQLKNLHEKTQKQLSEIPVESRVLITAHDAFGYFGRAYQVEVKGLQGISTLSEYGLKDVADLVDFIVKRKIKAVFVETSIPQKSLEAVVQGCKQKNHAVKIGGTLFSDAMGADGTPEGTYIGMVEANVKTIVEALK
jgi:manganese/zinc/iron transport system substrate-binding protein